MWTQYEGVLPSINSKTDLTGYEFEPIHKKLYSFNSSYVMHFL